jgi:CDP-diacylglycerol--glycerol-3-phosphate 3-phosphatidyltransferase
MGIYAVKPRFQKTLKPLENLFVRYHVHPTVINILGLIASVIMAGCILLSVHHAMALILVPFLAFFRTACNALDGLVSRRLGVASSMGEVFNELIDRISDILIFISLILLPQTHDMLGYLALLIVLLNSYLGILSKSAGGSRQYGGLMGKADRMIYISVAALVVLIFNQPNWWNIFLGFVLVGTVITFVQRFNATKNELRAQLHGQHSKLS